VAMESVSKGPEKTWVFGKAQPGWYVARWTWNKVDADRWEALGYKVQRSIEKPEKA
jgi:hypothetical protein